MFLSNRRLLILLIILLFTILYGIGCGPHPIEYTLTMEIEGHGTLYPDVGSHTFERGTIVDVTAEPSEDWEFKEWIGQVADTESPETTIVINEDTTVKAVFQVIEDYPIDFKDENLEQAVREAIQKMEGDLFLEDVIDLEVLEAIGGGIVSLEGIEYLYHLKILNLDMDGQTHAANYIEDVSPLENLIHLKELHLSGNKVSNINPLANLTNLEVLNLFLNQVEDIVVLENLVQLKELELSRNVVRDITPLENLHSLKFFRFNSNQVTDIQPLAHLTQLEFLDLGRNEVKDISPLENLIELEWLSFTWNQVEDISVVENFINLKELGFSGNQVTDISVLENLTNLKTLWFLQNEVRDIRSLVANEGLDSESWIDLRNNYLDLTEGSQNMEDINELIEREVFIMYEPQRDPED